MNGTLRLGSIFGIPLLLHWSFPLLLAWVVWTGSRAGASPAEIGLSCVFVLAIFGCVLLHECGHALAARRYGISTRDITLLPIGGLARLERMPATPAGEIVVALAGPLVNVAIALVLGGFFLLRDGIAETLNVPVDPFAGGFARRLMAVNVLLVLFNLIPAFPMDGGRVLRAVLSLRLGPARASLYAAYVSMTLAAGFAAWGLLGGGGPFLLLIGVFIFIAARATASNAKRLLAGSLPPDRAGR
ncbi:site-2 protease family protein [Phycisphaera mikurensis]|uniref:Peptidase M50 family protein n=1 Tax=Phycisphaera mikurensis (strain NBRC 102666 / KCTC 22515 / FYK2301M01) TaxID=1142394 RepID=I0IHX1_PHYMF|nr:site-2 protease family protein [Phycisphaera mikurensis]MBB6441100.1 Zn-dependent protease [Phycisphaera mikurensis]BAM04859.1 peptidase M50 family protein [Phycisphaera mikurensis NBRC 102666]